MGFGGETSNVVELEELEGMVVDELVDWEVVVVSGVELVTKPELELDVVVELVTELVTDLIFEFLLDFELEVAKELESVKDLFEVALEIELEAGIVT